MHPAPDFRLYHGNDLAVLAGVLAAELAKPAPRMPLLEPDTVLIPQPAMKRWLQNTLAQAHGVAANLRFLTPGEFVQQALQANLDPVGAAALASAAALRWRLWALLVEPAATRDPVLAPLRALLERGDRALAAWSLAGEIAAAFEKYQAWRGDWLQRWDGGADPRDWQAELWRRATRGEAHRAARIAAYLARFSEATASPPHGLPARVFAFACQNVSPDVLRVIASAAQAGTLHFFFVSPVEGWWGDLRTLRERLRDAPDDAFEDDEETPLLRANGAAGRDFVRLLFGYEIAHPSIDLPIYVPPDPERRRGLLHRLQRDLLARRAPRRGDPARPAFDGAARQDASLQLHACATRLRELEVLHDQLRALLEADASLQPRDIAVLAPDIDAYAAQVHAVFGTTPGAHDAIPYAIADTGAARGSALIAAFLDMLALPQSRFESNAVIELLATPVIAQRLGLESDELTRLRDWVATAGARWGLDAAHRVAAGAPDEAAYSWVWALDRLLLGHASGDTREIDGVAPLPLVEGGGLETLDGLLRGLRALARWRREFASAHAAPQWQARLARAVEELFPAEPDDDDERHALDRVRAALGSFGRELAQAGIDTPLAPEVVRAWFDAELAEADARQPFLTGGVTFARMVPMRLIPFRVICLLGMDDGAFPRRDPVGGVNRIDAALGSRQRRPGDRSLRDDDRALFLQLFAAATDTFYVSWLGLDPRSGETLPPSVVVAELIDVAADMFAQPDGDALRDALVVRHPLQPFAPEAFGAGDARRFGYRAGWRIQPQRPAASMPPFAGALPPRDERGEEWTLDELRRDLAHPLRTWLRERVDLRLDAADARLPDSEPFARDDGLHRHALTQRVFAELVAHDAPPSATVLARRLLAEGRIAPAAAGLREVATLRASLLAARERWRELAAGRAEERHIVLELDGTRLRGTLAPVHHSGLLQFRAGKPHGRTRIALALEWLLWSAAGETRPVHSLVLGDGWWQRLPLAPPLARAALSQLLALARMARREALPLMPDAAWIYVEALARKGDASDAFERAANAWQQPTGGEGSDAWVRLALRGADPFDPQQPAAAARFRALAGRLFAALDGEPGVSDAVA